MTRTALLKLLWERADDYVSGEELAGKLHLSRTAVWKGIEQLREEGYLIDSVTRRGHRLSSLSDVLSEERIREYLNTEGLRLQVRRTVTSTNTVLKTLAEQGEAEGLCLLAEEQTAGRGRRGRNFWSPKGGGLYLSLLLRPKLQAADTTAVTTCAAVAVAQAIESLAPVRAEIKWVNDIFVEGKKVCGILTEASLDCESGGVHYVIVGIGINTRLPEQGCPEELRNIAGSAFGKTLIPELRCRLTAAVLDRFMESYHDLNRRSWFDEYRERSLILGKPVLILQADRTPEQAEAVGLGEDFSLLVRMQSGEIRSLNTGEVSIQPGEFS